MMRVIICCVSLLFFNSSAKAAKLETAKALQEAFNQVAAGAKPAVVNIQVIQEQEVRFREPQFFFGTPEDFFEEFFFGPRRRRKSPTYRWRTEGMGSGIIIDSQGCILTNEHVIRGADEIKITRVRPDGKEISYAGKVVGKDPRLDLAVVKIHSARKLPYVHFGDSNKVRVGDWAIAIGSPFELQQTVTLGIISAVRQSLRVEGRRYPNLIQTDAAINRGNSGGPLLDIDGRLIGINTAIFSPSGAFAGIGFAIPSNEIKEVLDDLMAGRKVRRGWLGINLVPVDSVIGRHLGLPSSEGALVNSVFRDSPAGRAGIRRGDVIIGIDGKDVKTTHDLINLVSSRRPGKKVKVELFRESKKKNIRVTLGERPDEEDLLKLKSLTLGDLAEDETTADTAKWEGVEVASRKGAVEITRVRTDSRLFGYIEKGDVINGINQHTVKNISGFKRIVKTASLSEGVVFDITRDNQPIYISVQVGE